MIHFKSKSFHLSWVLAVIAAAILVYLIEDRYKTQIVDIPVFNHTSITEPTPTPSSATSSPRGPNTPSPTPPSPTPSAYPATLNLKVPFTAQAPTANWDELHNEACEEASAIMAYAYFSGRKETNLSPVWVEEELAKITEWEKQKFGYYLDINADETATLLREFYGLNTKVIQDYTEDDFKKELAQNHLILPVANGQKLGNPNFRRPGPPYHMYVVKGYTGSNFVTNDPGTRNGLNYIYTFQTILNAGGDWSHEINAVDQGVKKAVVVWK